MTDKIKRINWSEIPEELKEQAIQMLRLVFGNNLLVFKYSKSGHLCYGVGLPGDKENILYSWDKLSYMGLHAALNTLIFHPKCVAVARWDCKGISPGAFLDNEPWGYNEETLAEEKFKTSMYNLIVIGWNEIV